MLLDKLSEAIGVSGMEDAVRAIVLDATDGHVTDTRIDALGSVTAIKTGTGSDRLRVMIAAHMDEVGMMVTGIDSNGLIKFTSVGGLDDRILPALRVRLGSKQVPGVIIWTPVHMNKDQNTIKMKDLRIDIGVTSKDAAASHVKLGDRIAFDSRFMEIGDKTLRGKAFDNRVGCSLLIDLLRSEPYPVDVLAAFTVQEEIGLRGAQVAAQTLEPDVALVLEGTPAHDVPNPLDEPDDTETAVNPATRLGAGPALTVMDRSMIVYPPLLNFLRDTAEKHDLPYQLKTQLGGGTDGGAIHMAGGGRPTAVISVPCRYIHTPNAYLNRDDYDNTLKLLQAILTDITRSVISS